MDEERLQAMAGRLEPIRRELLDEWDDIGPEYGVRGGETRLSLVTKAVVALLDEIKNGASLEDEPSWR